jgi:Methylamine utilisation protein MauE
MSAVAVDPLLALCARLALALLFAVAAAHKLRDVGAFRAALEGYRLLPPPWAVPAGALLIAAEIGVAAALCLPRVSGAASLTAAGLLGLYGYAMAINLARGRRDIDCGCGGPARRQPLSGWLLGRNAALALAALLAALPTTGRALGWLDALTALAAVTALALLYVAADGLLATAPRLAALRDRHARTVEAADA